MTRLIETLGPGAALVIEAAELLASGRSVHQAWEVWDTPAFGRLYRLDGQLMATERDADRCHRALVRPACVAHGDVRHALVLGGGDGGSAQELLRLPGLERVVVAELDAAVVQLTRDYLPALCGGTFEDRRLQLVIGDARDYVARASSTRDTQPGFDLVVFDLTAADGSAAALHGEDFFRACRRVLAPRGLIALHLASPLFTPRLVALLLQRLHAVFPAVRPYRCVIPSYGGMWTMALAGDAWLAESLVTDLA